jgi:hypothetical protein
VPCRDRPLPCAGRRHAGSGARRVGKPIFRRMPTEATIAEARPPKEKPPRAAPHRRQDSALSFRRTRCYL